MFDFLSTYSDDDAIMILKHDHDKVKDLFDKFEKAGSLREKKKIAFETITELKIHTAIEEEIFYPAVRKAIGKKIMNEADEEHHVAKVLVAELEVMDGKEDHYDAKYKVLSENVRHHIKEEERDMLPKCRALDMDFTALGQKMLARKTSLKKSGVATFGEERMVAASKGRGDSSAKAAAAKPAAKPVKLVKKTSKASPVKPGKTSRPAPKKLKIVTSLKPAAKAKKR